MTELINIEQATAKVLQAALTELGVAFKKKAKVEELRKLLGEAQDRANLGINPANDPLCEIFGDPKSGHPACQDCLRDFGKRYDACVEAKEEAKKAKKAGSKGGPASKVRGKYSTFEELSAHLTAAPEKRLTMVVDKLLLEGYTLKDLLSEVEERKTLDFKDSNDFKSIAILKKHVAFRASKGWIFTISAEGSVKLTGYSDESQKVSWTAPAAKPEDVKKAA